MKKGLLKKILGVGAAVAMMAGSLLSVSAEPTTVTATEVGNAYYNAQGLTDPSLMIQKHVIDTDDPIKGVVFKYVKVGGLYEVKSGNSTSMAYGISSNFAAAINLEGSQADYRDNTNYYYKDSTKIQDAVRKMTATELQGFLNSSGATVGTTDETGNINAQVSWGLYLVVETDVSQAKVKDNGQWKSISVTQIQKPFIAAVPAYDEKDKTWDSAVIAKVKNSTGSANIEKKIVTSDSIPTQVTQGSYDDTDITSIGDTVYFCLKSDLIPIPKDSPETISQYIMTDRISAGLEAKLDNLEVRTYNGSTEIALTKQTDYTVGALTSYSGEEAAFTGGKEFTITFTAAGLEKLTALAKSESTTKAVYAYYPAGVTENAIIGDARKDAEANSGNPNQVKLTYQVSGSAVIDTDWDKVTEFTFGIDLEKQLEGGAISASNKDDIQFRVYSGTTDKTYYTFEKKPDGVYTKPAVAESMEKATLLSPDASGHIQIKGLEEGTYFVEEVQTVDGYNLLTSPVEFEIRAQKSANSFVGSTDQYMGTLRNDNDGYMEATVINTKGFQLPATGGAGIWMFVLGGAAVILAGCAYFVVTRKNNTTK